MSGARGRSVWVLDPPRSSSLPRPHGVRPLQLTCSTWPFHSWAMSPAMRLAFLLSVTLKSPTLSPSHGWPLQADLAPPLPVGVVAVSSLRTMPQVPSRRWLRGRGAWRRGDPLTGNPLCAHGPPTQGASDLKCLPHIPPRTPSLTGDSVGPSGPAWAGVRACGCCPGTSCQEPARPQCL